MSLFMNWWKLAQRVGKKLRGEILAAPTILPQPAAPALCSTPADAKLPRWKAQVPSATDPEAWKVFTVRARTKSEARARAKATLGLHSRLPVGTRLERVVEKRPAPLLVR